jgi:hypothetical protein
MNHAFSSFLAENQRPKNFQAYPQIARGINMAIKSKMFCGKIPSCKEYNRESLAKKTVTNSNF